MKTKILSHLDVHVANKTGKLATVEIDIGTVMSNKPYAVVVLTNEVSNSQMVGMESES